MDLSAFSEKKHIIWDWNGTILDDVHYAIDTINWLLQRHRLDPIDYDHYRFIFDFPVRVYYDRLGFDYSLTSFEDLCHEFVEKYMADFTRCLPFPSIHKALKESRRVCDCQSILSATDQSSLNEMVDHFDMSNLFDHVFGTDNRLAHSKIDRGRELVETSGYLPSESLLVGDTLHDAEVGKELGIEVVLVTHGHQCTDKLEQAGVPLLHLER